MNFWQIGSVSQYTKSVARQTQWKLKKRSGDFLSHPKSLSDSVTFHRAADVLPGAEERDDKLAAIIAKAEAGKKLSQAEWEYLREKNPALYEKLRELEQEAENYEKALRRCKTRDEAQRLHMNKLADIMASAKEGDGSALFRLNRMTRTMTEFTESAEYHELPTEAEEAIRRESERQARVEALQAEQEARKAERAEAAEEAAEAAAETEREPQPEPEETAEAAAAKPETKPEAKQETKPEAKQETKPEAKQEAKPEAKPATRKPAPEAARPGKAALAARRPASETRGETGAAPALSYGQRAYQKQQSSASRAPRPRAVDAEA